MAIRRIPGDSQGDWVPQTGTTISHGGFITGAISGHHRKARMALNHYPGSSGHYQRPSHPSQPWGILPPIDPRNLDQSTQQVSHRVNQGAIRGDDSHRLIPSHTSYHSNLNRSRTLSFSYAHSNYSRALHHPLQLETSTMSTLRAHPS